jgi:hypothetical protein
MQWDRFRYTTAQNYIHNYPDILDLKVNAASGIYDVVGVTNWRGDLLHKKLSFADQLGLPSGSYAVMDFWKGKLLGVFESSVDVDVSSHDTDVLLIHPALDHPQLMGTGRHISGAYSIEDQAWDPAANRLHGKSTTVAGEPYSLWIRVPAGYSLSAATASSGSNNVEVKSQSDGELLTFTIPGQEGPVDWQVSFMKRRSR